MLNRRKYWRTLQYLSGLDVAKLDADHHVRVGSLAAPVQGIGGGARILDRLDRPRDVRAGGVVQCAGLGRFRGGADAGGGCAGDGGTGAAAATNGSALVTLAEEDLAKCNNCKTCYQDLSELFEKTKIMVDGATKEVAHLIPGALDHVKVTPELKTKVARVAANCDAEIIHAQ